MLAPPHGPCVRGTSWPRTPPHPDGNKKLREPAPRREDVHTRYFEQLNPGFRDGDMRPCLVPLGAANLATLVGRTARYLLSRAVGRPSR